MRDRLRSNRTMKLAVLNAMGIAGFPACGQWRCPSQGLQLIAGPLDSVSDPCG